jgi:dinuclear metal center YbgI/SA1388 family protein
MLVKDITSLIENFAPLSYQESYDNAGLITGNSNQTVTGALLSLDCIEATIDEAIDKKCNLIIAHHPIIFGGLKKITGSNYVERTIIKAIQNNIAIYASHTNLDNVQQGVNAKIAQKLGLVNGRILAPKKQILKKLVTFVPQAQAENLRTALFEAGAGHIGNYDSCSFNTTGNGTFKGNDATQPFVGTPNQLHTEAEVRIETVFLAHLQVKIISALLKNHPYEEVAYDIYSLDNALNNVGSGYIADLPEELTESQFLYTVKANLKAGILKHTHFTGKIIRKVALCGGSGQFLLKTAIAAGADAFITADFKYHEFFDAEGKILLIDAGHYETEQFTPEIFIELIQNKFPTFATYLSEINTNPVNYF